MVDILVKAIITKEEGRKLIKKTPLDKFQKISDYSKRTGKLNSKYIHKELVCGKYEVVTNSQLSILTLFNDICAFCGKPFTHYIIGKTFRSGNSYCNLYPVRFESDGEIIYYNIDHIIPKSLGGANRLDNYQLSCEDLNLKKGNELTEDDKKYGCMSTKL